MAADQRKNEEKRGEGTSKPAKTDRVTLLTLPPFNRQSGACLTYSAFLFSLAFIDRSKNIVDDFPYRVPGIALPRDHKWETVQTNHMYIESYESPRSHFRILPTKRKSTAQG